jgi:hypothetical protein
MWNRDIRVQLLDISIGERIGITRWIRKNLGISPKEAIEMSKQDEICLDDYHLAIDLFESIQSGKCNLLIKVTQENPGYNSIPGDCY